VWHTFWDFKIVPRWTVMIAAGSDKCAFRANQPHCPFPHDLGFWGRVQAR
jgi:hypothetical protein